MPRHLVVRTMHSWDDQKVHGPGRKLAELSLTYSGSPIYGSDSSATHEWDRRCPDSMELLKQVSLVPKQWNEWPLLIDSSHLTNTIIRRKDCASFGDYGMVLLVHVFSNHFDNLKDAVGSITGDSNVRAAYFSSMNEKAAIGFVILKSALACRTVKGQMAFCKNCLLNDCKNQGGEREWQIILEESALESFLGKLKSAGISATIKDLKDLQSNDHLTSRQDEVLKYALQKGYFDFPKKHNMNELADFFGISIPSLCETLRRAEKKIVSQYYIP